MEPWLFHGSEWEPDASHGVAYLNFSHPWHRVGGMTSGWGAALTGLVWIYGAAPGSSSVVVSIEDKTYSLPVGENGAWAFMSRALDLWESKISVSEERSSPA